MFDGLAAVSLVLCVATVALWVRGISTDDEVFINLFGHRCIAGSFPNHADFIFYRRPVPPEWMLGIFPGVKHIPSRPEYRELRFIHDWNKCEVAIPWWFVLMFLLALPLWTAMGVVRRKRRKARGVCVNCGYDLTGNVSGVCSECGKVIQRVVPAK
jgi:hypothetical protein